jgi:glutaredoxin
MKRLIFLFFILLLFLTGCTGKYDEFGECLTIKGATMYGTSWCTYCKSQKALFGNSFKQIHYVDCDIEKDRCLKDGVEGYPTWIIDGKSYSGEQSLQKLSALTECPLEGKS